MAFSTRFSVRTENKAGYTAELSRAIRQSCPNFIKRDKTNDTDGRTDGRTDGLTYKAGYNVHANKNRF